MASNAVGLLIATPGTRERVPVRAKEDGLDAAAGDFALLRSFLGENGKVDVLAGSIYDANLKVQDCKRRVWSSWVSGSEGQEIRNRKNR